MDASQITTAQRITVIKHSLNGRDDDFIATATGLSSGAVNHVLAAAGSPNQDQMRRLLERLEEAGVKRAASPATHTSPRLGPVTPAPPVARPATAPTTDTIANLLAAAHQHDMPAIRKAAEKIDTLLTVLRTDIKADREDAARRKEIAELEARLAELKGKKKPSKRTASNLVRGEFPCDIDGCDATFDTKQGVTMHNTRKHRDHAVAS
ncbi:MAG TPA: hypothetical protein VGF17_24610 [Phytomonospora sp.]